MLGLPVFHGGEGDSPLGDDGRYDSTGMWVACGVVAPAILFFLCGMVIWSGGVTLPTDDGLTFWRYDGLRFVSTAVTVLVGIALICVARFLLPNVFRTSYDYQYFALAGIALVAIGLVGFVVAALIS